MSERRIKRNTFSVHLTGTKSGLGLRIVGGKKGEQPCGIFIKQLIEGKLASLNGGLQVGDQLLSVNSVNLEGVSVESALDIMRDSTQHNEIDLLIARDEEARKDFKRLSEISQSQSDEGNRSDLTDVSDLTHNSEDLLDTRLKIPVKVELHHVQLSVDSSTLSNDSVPPPLPTSLPPSNGEDIDSPSVPPVVSSYQHDSAETRNESSYRPSTDGGLKSHATNKSHHIQEVPISNTTAPIYATIDDDRTATTKPSSRTASKPNPRFSVLPSNKFNLEKLLWALQYIGTVLTNEQLEILHERLQIDSNGKVVFSEFLELVQQLIPAKLDKGKLLEVFYNKPVAAPQQPIIPKEENTETVLIKELQSELNDLNSKLKEEQKKNDAITKNSDILKTLATKECELRKMEASNRRYQVAVDILEKFVEDCHEALTKSKGNNGIEYIPHGTGSPAIRGDQLTGNPRPPQYLSKHTKKTAVTLANDAKEALAEVRRIITVKELPYGWEEEYTEEGKKYYVNHDTQSTSWVHPVTRQLPPASAKKLPKEAKEK